MGPGSVANLGSAATVALSSLEMRVREPGRYLEKIDKKRFARLCGDGSMGISIEPTYSTPVPAPRSASAASTHNGKASITRLAILSGKVQRFGDNVDTDAISPGK